MLNLTKQKAFTLIEFIIVMVLLTIVSASSSFLLVQGFSAFSTGRNILDADWQSRTAIERMTRDMREIPATTNITTATSSTFTFTDINGNNISYQLSGTQLMRTGTSGTAQILADGIQSLTFTYYDDTGATTTQISSINYIVISLGVSYNGVSFNLTTAVYPWNLT